MSACCSPASTKAAIARRYAQVGTAWVIAFGCEGAEMLDHALMYGAHDWRPRQVLPQDANIEAHVLLADPNEPGASEAVGLAVQLAKAQCLLSLAVFKRLRPRVPEPDQICSKKQFLRGVADVTVAVPWPESGSYVSWEGLFAPFIQDTSPGVDVGDLREFALEGMVMSFGCGLDKQPKDAMLAAIAHSSLGILREGEVGNLLVTMVANGSHVLLRETFEACQALGIATPHAKMAFVFRSNAFLGKQTIVHLVAFGSQPRIQS